jgi:hypothetical protein
MALVRCPDCDRKIGETAKMCVYCGGNVAAASKIRDQRGKEWLLVIAVLTLITLVLRWLESVVPALNGG